MGAVREDFVSTVKFWCIGDRGGTSVIVGYLSGLPESGSPIIDGG